MRIAHKDLHSVVMNLRPAAFFSASCLLHAALLWQVGEPQRPVLNIGGEAKALRVTLAGAAGPAAPAPSSVKSTAQLPPPDRHPPPRPAASAPPLPKARSVATAQPAAKALRPTTTRQAETTPPATPRSEPERVAASSTARAQTATSLSVSERVSAALQSQLAESFDYPWLARKRGWQGLVTLSLHIDRHGALSRWKVIRTSGYSLLDRSALRAAQRIGRLQQADSLLNGQALNLNLPVRYQLLDS